MTSHLDTSSAIESSMEEAANRHRHRHRHRHRLSSSAAKPNPSTVTTATTTRNGGFLKNASKNGDAELDEDAMECDPEVWEMFNSSFREVQTVLDRNRVLIQQVNENHKSKAADNMVKNVALIQEINQNISRVVSLYSDLSSNFSTALHDQQRERNSDGSSPKDSSPES